MKIRSSGLGFISVLRTLSISRPILTFQVSIVLLSWILLTLLFFLHVPLEPGILVLTFLGLVGISSLITLWTKGKPGVRAMFAETFRWRVHVGYYLYALFAIPFLTILVSLVLGTFVIPQHLWLSSLQTYVLSVASGFLIINLWEETGWTGFVQSKLMKKRGIFLGSILTAPGFVAVHVPLYFSQPTAGEFFISVAILLGLAVFFRYLLGMIYMDSARSVLIVGLLHASFNSSPFGYKQMLPASIIATIVLTLAYSLYRNIVRRTNHNRR